MELTLIEERWLIDGGEDKIILTFRSEPLPKFLGLEILGEIMEGKLKVHLK